MQRVQIVGILNVTPDSFADGGRYVSVETAVARAVLMLEEGADIIDVGGESTGPGSANVSEEEELHRTIPVIKEIKKGMPKSVISIDTFKAGVAHAAIEAGAVIVNDVTAGRGDPDMLATVANTQASLVLMYSKDPTARTTIHEQHYSDVVATVKAFLHERMKKAEEAGIPLSRIILDPGLGHFISSLPEYSFEILDRLREFSGLGCPLLLSPSRKSFLAGPEKLPVSQRLPVTVAASVLAAKNGATYIRTHDVREVRDAVVKMQNQ